MRVSISKSKNYEFIYIIKDIYSNGSRTSKTYEKLGKIDDLCKEKNMSRDELIIWAKQYAKELTQKEKDDNHDTIIAFSPDRIIKPNSNRKYNCGYLFLQDIYYKLKINNICRNIKARYKFKYDLDAILSDLIYSRILCPSSKRSSYELSLIHI